MKNKIIARIAMAQVNFTVGDLRGNAEKIIYAIDGAVKKDVDIITFPELSITGYPPEDLLLKKQFIEDNIKELKNIAKYTRDIVAVVGFANSSKGKIFNSAAVLHNGKIRGTYNKMLLPNYGVFDEKRYFAQSKMDEMAFNANGLIFGVNICEDIWHSEDTLGLYNKLKAKLLLNINASPYYAGKINLREDIVKKVAKNNKIVVSYNNLVGGQDELVFDGQSLFVDAKGSIIARGEAFKEDLIIIDMPFEIGKVNRSKNLVLIDHVFKSDKVVLEKRFAKKPGELNEIYSALLVGLRDYVKKNNFKKVILGLSGGIDSSITAAISVDALGKENVIGVFMPTEITSNESFVDAKALADNLGIQFMEIPIGDIYDHYLGLLKTAFEDLPKNIAEENLQARIRGNVLMAISNKFGYMVLTTGNKSEVSCGYCTLYGDTAGGFAVLKDVPKTLVYRLSEYRNAISVVIPSNVLIKAPTAELRPNQKDTDSLPPYDILDKILKLYVEDDVPFQKIVRRGFDKELVKKVISLVDNSEYKRRQGPPGVKITPKAFGRDRRMPIINRYRE